MKRIGLCIVAVIVAISGAAPAHAATFPGENDVIAFPKGPADKVWTVDPVSGETTRLLKAGSSEAVWSPHGRFIAYVRSGRIFVATAAGKDIYSVFRGRDVADRFPQWSADGSKLAFVRTKASGVSAVYTVAFGRHNAKNVSGWGVGKSYRAPSWSPDGGQMVYEEYDDVMARLLIKNLASGRVRELTRLSDVTESSQAAWSPTGKKILFRDSSNELYTIWTDGTHRTVISDGGSYNGSWSPTGDKIAFIEDPSDDHVSITQTDGTVEWVPVDKGAYARIGTPTWSPDGKKLAFALKGENGQDIFVIDVAAGTQRLVAKGAGTDELSWRSR